MHGTVTRNSATESERTPKARARKFRIVLLDVQRTFSVVQFSKRSDTTEMTWRKNKKTTQYSVQLISSNATVQQLIFDSRFLSWHKIYCTVERYCHLPSTKKVSYEHHKTSNQTRLWAMRQRRKNRKVADEDRLQWHDLGIPKPAGRPPIRVTPQMAVSIKLPGGVQTPIWSPQTIT